jgi:hypothetical protein
VNNLARLVNEEWFASDIIPTPNDDTGSDLIIQFAFDTKAVISISFDSGASWTEFNNGFAPEAETVNVFSVFGLNTDQINFRADKAGTILYARVFEKGGAT